VNRKRRKILFGFGLRTNTGFENLLSEALAFCVFVLYSFVLAYFEIQNIVFCILFHVLFCSCVVHLVFSYACFMCKALLVHI
jgi:hypothetical protein